MDVDVRDGGCQIEYEDQDPRIHELYMEELRSRAMEARMEQLLHGTRA